MRKYFISGKEYLSSTDEHLLEQVKAENPHTKNLSLQDYMDNVAANVINSMTEYNVPIPSKASSILEVWKKIGIIQSDNKS